MRNFVGYAENEKFKVGCTGQTTYVYDKEEECLEQIEKLRLSDYIK